MKGFGSLAISTEGSDRVEMTCKQKERFEYLLSYRPPEPGIYQLIFKYGNDHISGILIHYIILYYFLHFWDHIKFAVEIIPVFVIDLQKKRWTILQ